MKLQNGTLRKTQDISLVSRVFLWDGKRSKDTRKEWGIYTQAAELNGLSIWTEWKKNAFQTRYFRYVQKDIWDQKCDGKTFHHGNNRPK